MCLFFSSFLCIMNLYQNTVNRGFFFFFGWRTWHFQGVRVLPGLLYKVVAINVKGGRKESVYHLFGGFIISSFFLLLFW